jgi:hypothetical protein
MRARRPWRYPSDAWVTGLAAPSGRGNLALTAAGGDGRLLYSAGVISAGAAHRDNHGLQEVYRDIVGLLPRFTVTAVVYDRGLPRNYRFTSEMALTLADDCATVLRVAMEGNRGSSHDGPVNMADAVDLVERVIRDIDAHDFGDADLLLTDLMCAAWPTRIAQSQ